jgi:hypothetical protein
MPPIAVTPPRSLGAGPIYLPMKQIDYYQPLSNDIKSGLSLVFFIEITDEHADSLY